MSHNDQPIGKLIWQAENGEQELLLQPEEAITIGREDTNTIVLSSARVSRHHARIEWNGTNFTIRDMSSSNGTIVNGQRLEYLPCVLNDGDLILIERIPMRFEKLVKSHTEQDASTLPTVPKLHKIKDAPKAILMISEGPECGREIVIDNDNFTIGRESNTATWQVRINDGTISRPQARIEHRQNKFIITDLGSVNGTTVNEMFVTGQQELNNGDVIGMGATKLIFRLKP